MKKVFKISLLSILFLISLFYFIYQKGYRVNFTPSYPSGIYKMIPKKKIEKGDFVIFCPPNTSLMQKALKRGYIKYGTCPGFFYPLLKKVVALEGDYVEVSNFIYINQQKIPNTQVFKKDSKGNTLLKTKDNNITIPTGYMFVISNYHPLSFDSRYIGLVEVNRTISQIKLVYTF